MKKTFFIAMISVFALLSCEKHNTNIVGCWVKPQYVESSENASVCQYQKANSLLENFEGIQFFENGTLIERKNAGWCGTPPIAYADFNGTWQQKHDTIIIDVEYWGGMEHKVWKILEISSSKLKIKLVSEIAYERYLLCGHWEWVKTAGGLAYSEYTPETEGYTRTLEIQENGIYKSYKNGELTNEGRYYFSRGRSIFTHEQADMIEFENYLELSSYHFSNQQDTLFLDEECYDCYGHTFIRVRN